MAKYVQLLSHLEIQKAIQQGGGRGGVLGLVRVLLGIKGPAQDAEGRHRATEDAIEG